MPWTEQSETLQPMGSQRVRHNWASEHNRMVHKLRAQSFSACLSSFVKSERENELILLSPSILLLSFMLGLVHRWLLLLLLGCSSRVRLCDPTDGSPPGSPIPGMLQARTLEWVAISFSNAWTWKVKVKSLSRTRLLATPWTAAYQAPPSMGFSRQEYWSGVPSPSLPQMASFALKGIWAATDLPPEKEAYQRQWD